MAAEASEAGDAGVLNAPYFGQQHDNIARRYLELAQAEGPLVVEGLAAAITDLFVSGNLLDDFRHYAVLGAWYARHPDRAERDRRREELQEELRVAKGSKPRLVIDNAR